MLIGNSRIKSLQALVGKGYKDFWNFKGRYRVVKGSRASKKSKTMALWTITNMMKYPKANMLVIRKVYGTLKTSCFTELEWAINQLGVGHLWKSSASPYELTYLPTGQKIYFRGLDNPLKITSITVGIGYLCWVWIEEAYEITKEEDFDMLDESIRGNTEGCFKQITLTLNPWSERHWIKKRFFDECVGVDDKGNPIYKERKTVVSEDGNIFALTTNYLINEFLDEADKKLFERMKRNNPKRYQVAGLGNWGIVDGLVYENWKVKNFDLKDVKDCELILGLDFGYTNDPTALFVGFLNLDKQRLFIWDEMYEKKLSNKMIAEKIIAKGYKRCPITCDSAEPKSIDELRRLGLRTEGAIKGQDSVNNGIQWIQDLEIIIHPRCINFENEISNYSWAKDKFGETLNKPNDEFNHLMDAMRYGLEKHILRNRWTY